MKPLAFIAFLLLCGFSNSLAQTSAWEKAYNDLPPKERDEYYENARFFLENVYYYQLAEAIEDSDIHEFLIKDLFGDENNVGAARFQPECLLEKSEQRFLTPSQYLQTLSNAFQENAAGLEFLVSNIREDSKLHGYTAPTNCFAQLDYDLEVGLQGRTLLKRRCRMLCLFPQALYKRNVRLMQIEPIKDIYIASESPSLTTSDEARLKEAMEWYEQGLEEKYLPVFKELAEKGMTEAEYQYGRYLYKKEEYENAVFWFTKAAEKESADAQNNLGICYEQGKGVTKDEAKAVVWYRKATEQRHAKAQCNLGICYLMGIGVTRDEDKAAKWFMIAAEQGEAIAQGLVGCCYREGIGMAKDEAKAVEWFTKAAEQGETIGQYELGFCYEYGMGVSKDYTKAVVWYAKAAEQGEAIAQKELGDCYKYGQGVAKDEKKAVEWYRKAAEQGYAEAQYNLGVCYEYGIGVLTDRNKAFEWYNKAAVQGDEAAKHALKKLQ